MPEYLAPGVYVEEIDTGSKPIEGVSTSTAGMIGVTERGPVNVPILITGTGEYTRWFGERLNLHDFPNGPKDFHYLPHAVEGFFTNGGKRLYVTRVLDTVGATRASFDLHDRGDNNSAWTRLLRSANELTGLAASPLYVLNVNAVLPNTGSLADGDHIRIGGGSDAEYRDVNIVTPAANATHVALSLPLNRAHAAAVVNGARNIARTLLALGGGTLTLAAATAAGAQTISVVGSNAATIGLLAVGQILEIGAQFGGEHRFIRTITNVNATQVTLLLDGPLQLAYASGATVILLDSIARSPIALGGGTLTLAAETIIGEDTISVVGSNAATIGLLAIGQILEIGAQFGGDRPSIRTITAVNATQVTLLLDVPFQVVYASGASVIPLDSTAAVVTDGNKHLDTPARPGDRLVYVQNRALAFTNREGLIVFDNADTTLREVRRIGSLSLLTLATGAYDTYGAGTLVEGVNLADDTFVAAKSVTAAVVAGATAIALNNRTNLIVGDVLRIGIAPNQEFVTIAALPNPSPGGAAPNPGNIILQHPLNIAHANGVEVRRQSTASVHPDRPRIVTALAIVKGETHLPITDGGPAAAPNGFVANDVVRVVTVSGDHFYHVVADSDDLDARPVSLTVPLVRSHAAGAPVVERARLLTVQAIDAGAWGNRLRIAIEDEATGLVARTTLKQVISPTQIRLASAAGVEAGTILEIVDTANNPVGAPVKVAVMNRATNDITLGGAGLTPAQQVVDLGVRSREFRLTVFLLRQPDPVNPVRNEMVLDFEVFRYLSLDPRHSHYVERVIGVTWDDAPGVTKDHADRPLRLSDHRSEGESWYIRVRDWASLDPNLPNDVARQAERERVRPGPEPLIDILPDGRLRPARLRLERTRGDDAIGSLHDDTYIGQDNPTPELRTGLQSLRNIEEISIVACPGRTSVQIQNALINHCELMRYRFAVLDGQQPPKDTLSDIQNQRQQFDTKYAALYHPWLLVPDPYPTNLLQVANFPVPPSGHVLGVYARTDIERGVHKAPANEVVRGILGLQRLLNKEQQDILNPYPVNINVIRDFRDNNRGIRIFGGRVITSDSDWKYVNVRRLLIFIENSLDRGLQWVVFEPNAEPLWARVRRTISNFLTLVWRNGALEGTKPEEAYFVKCDRTTMTQTDIDSGRLICLIGVAPVKPAEFVIIRIGLWTAHAED